MKQRLFQITAAFLCLCMLLPLYLPVSASAATEQAQDITKQTTATGSGYASFSFLFDKDVYTYRTSNSQMNLTLKNSDGMGSLYLLFDTEYGPYTVTNNDTGESYTAGTYRFLHEFIDLAAVFESIPTSVTLSFTSGTARLSELYVFSEGEAPDFVQRWQPPLEGGADIVLFSTHGDDEQLFFAGLLPYYAGALGLGVQVVYLTDHRCYTSARTHEMLNGLWGVGVDAYPVFGSYEDFRNEDDALSSAYRTYEILGDSKEELVGFVVEQLRRFKPLVAVGHDINGEYGHGMHKLYCDLLMQAVEISQDASKYPELAEKYGTWDVPKTYLHLYEENPIVIDYDIPLDAFDGLTAFQVTQKYGFPCHRTQHQYDFFVNWLYGKQKEITKASQISKYSPCEFGLYRSTVGEDVQKNDFMENLISYAEQARLEAERLEQERLDAERQEQERLEAERQEAQRQEQERLEQERLEAEQAAQAQKDQQAQDQAAAVLKEQQARQRQRIMLICLVVLLVSLIGLVISIVSHVRHRRRKKRR